MMVAALAAMVAFASCAKDENTSNGKEETKSFYLKIGNESVTRAAGLDQSAATVTLSNGFVIFADGDNIGRVLEVIATGTTEDDKVTVADLESGVEIGEIPANTTMCYFYGNLGSSLSGISTAAVKDGSMANVNALTWTLANIQNVENNVAIVPVFGSGPVAPGVANPNRLEAKFNVKPIASRLQLGQVSVSDARVTSFKLAGIYINGYYHSMDANSTFKAAYMIDNSIDISKYPTAGYAAPYATMSDVFSPKTVTDSAPAEVGSGLLWAYNFFPATMPHIVLSISELVAEGQTVTNKWCTVAKYSTDGAGSMFNTAVAGEVYTLNIDISDYTKQIDDLPESNSEVIGYIDVDVVNWTGKTLYPEW